MQEEEGIEIPDIQPPLFPDLSKYFQAFWFLSESRQKYVGMTQIIDGPILLSEIESYFNIHYINNLEDRLDYVRFVKTMDRSYLKYKHDNPEKPEKTPDE